MSGVIAILACAAGVFYAGYQHGRGVEADRRSASLRDEPPKENGDK